MQSARVAHYAVWPGEFSVPAGVTREDEARLLAGRGNCRERFSQRCETASGELRIVAEIFHEQASRSEMTSFRDRPTERINLYQGARFGSISDRFYPVGAP